MTLMLIILIILCVTNFLEVYLIVNYLGVKITFDVKKRGAEPESAPVNALTDEEKADLEDLKNQIKAQNKAFDEMLSYSPEIAYGLNTKQE